MVDGGDFGSNGDGSDFGVAMIKLITGRVDDGGEGDKRGGGDFFLSQLHSFLFPHLSLGYFLFFIFTRW